LVKGVGDVAKTACLNARVNAPVTCLGFSQSSPHLYKPADVLMDAVVGNVSICVDVTIGSPLSEAKSNTSEGKRPGFLTTAHAKTKIAKHGGACSLAGLRFLPFSVDTCGMLDVSAVELLQDIASQQARHSDRSYSECMSFCRKRISFALQLGVARQLLASINASPFVIVGTVDSSSGVGDGVVWA